MTIRVLLLEDEAALAQSLRRGLQQEGFDVRIAATGPQAVDLAVNHEFDVLCLDIMVPGLNGYDVLKTLRNHRIETPVMMLTAKDGEYDQVDAFDLGADDYLTKPFSFVVLVARLRALARRGGTPKPQMLQVGSLTLDPARRLVRRGENVIALTSKEYALLHFLIARADDVVSKSDILDGVWDTEHGGSENLVEVYVGYLRRKIDTAFGVQSLHTVRGMGYRLSAEQPVAAPGEPAAGQPS